MGDFEGDYDWGFEWDFERDDPVLRLGHKTQTKEQLALQDISNIVGNAKYTPEQIITRVQDVCSRLGYIPNDRRS